MVKVNESSALEVIVPNIFIKKITLEASGKVDFEKNPHIDHEREPDVIRNKRTGKLERQVLTPDLVKKTQTSEQLSISIDLILKEKLDNGIVSSWFGDKEFLKYLKIHILQSTSAKLTNLLATKSISLSSVRERTLNRLDKEAVHRTIQVQDVLTDSSLDNKISYIDENGNKIYDISFRVSFSIRSSDPEHLSYFAVAYLDLGDLAKDFNLDLPIGADKVLEGLVVSEVVIREHKLVSETYAFVDEQGQVWAGPVNQLENGRWKTGNDDSENGKYVEIVTLPNHKIQDFRDINNLEKRQIDFSIIENELFSIGNDIKVKASNKYDIVRKSGYFSDSFISRDNEGNVRFAFSVDYLKLIKENTVFGALYRADNIELLDDNVKIRSMKILRARVKGDDFQIKDERGLRTFDENEEPTQIVVFSGETEPNVFKDADTKNGSLREIKIHLEKVPFGIRHFTGMDKTMDTVTFGKYQYGVEIEVEDRTAFYLLDKLDELLFVDQVVKEYYNEASLVTNFDVISNQFNQEFIQKQEKLYADNEETAPWTIAIASYLSTMDILIEDFTSETYEKVFLSYLHPRTGNPSSILTVINLIENLSSKIANIVGTILCGKVSKFSPGQSQWKPQSTLSKSGNGSDKSFKVENFFPLIFDSDIPKDVGYDFLSTGNELKREMNTDGLLVVSNSEYYERTEKEILKYYKTTDLDINIKTEKIQYTVDDSLENNRYAFLTPATIKIGPLAESFEFLDKGSGLYDVKQYGQISTDLMIYNASFKSPFIPTIRSKVDNKSTISKTEQIVQTNFVNLFADMNLIIMNEEEIINKDLTSKEIAGTSQINKTFGDADKMVGTSSFFSTENKMVDVKLGQGSLEADINTRRANSNSLMLKIAAPLIRNGPSALMRTTTVREKENKIKTGTMKFWDINSAGNGLDVKVVKSNASQFSNLPETQKLRDMNDRKVAEQFQTVPIVDVKKQSYVKELPNQLKSLFVGSIKQNNVVKDWFKDIELKDSLKNPQESIMFDMNYKILNKIEVLSGYGRERLARKEGNFLLKDPLWVTLTPELFNKSIDKNLICRMKEYQDKTLGIERPKALQLPIFNEYFILSPQKQILKPIEQPTLKKLEKTRSRVVKSNNNTVTIKPEFCNTLITARTRIPNEMLEKATLFGGKTSAVVVAESEIKATEKVVSNVLGRSVDASLAKFRIR